MFSYARIYLIFSCSLLLSIWSYGQSFPSIRSDRPGQSNSAFVVGTGVIQIQSGIDRTWVDGITKEDLYVLDNVLRLGLNEVFELSAVLDYSDQQVINVNPSIQRTGISATQLGFRYNLINDSKGWIQGLGFQTRFKLKIVDKDFRSQQMAPIMTFMTSHNLTESLGLTTNWGVNYDGITAIPTYFATTSLSKSINSKLGSFIEVYGNLSDSYGRGYIDGGFSYLCNNNLQLDSYLGWGNNFAQNEFFISLGISWRRKIFN